MKRVLHVLATQIEFRMLLVVIVVMVSLSLSSPYFFTASNLYNVMDQSVVTGMVALGQTLVILIGGIDLSVGALAGVTGIVLGLACHAAGLFGGIAACLGVGALAGLINGVIITYGGVAAICRRGSLTSLPGRSLVCRWISPACWRRMRCAGCS
jgi:ribose transport system permease protein